MLFRTIPLALAALATLASLSGDVGASDTRIVETGDGTKLSCRDDGDIWVDPDTKKLRGCVTSMSYKLHAGKQEVSCKAGWTSLYRDGNLYECGLLTDTVLKGASGNVTIKAGAQAYFSVSGLAYDKCVDADGLQSVKSASKQTFTCEGRVCRYGDSSLESCVMPTGVSTDVKTREGYLVRCARDVRLFDDGLLRSCRNLFLLDHKMKDGSLVKLAQADIGFHDNGSLWYGELLVSRIFKRTSGESVQVPEGAKIWLNPDGALRSYSTPIKVTVQ